MIRRVYHPEVWRGADGVLARSLSGTELRYATTPDLKPIDSLRKIDGNSLGFIPIAVYESNAARTYIAGRDRWRTQQLLVCEDNGDVTGFVFASYAMEHGDIVQVCVRRDARRMERALLMTDYVEGVAARAGKAEMRCRVAADIEAVEFWKAAGYLPLSITVSTFLNQRESTTRRELIVFGKMLDRPDMLQARLAI